MKCQMCAENEADIRITTSMTALSTEGKSAVEKIEKEAVNKGVIACVGCLFRMGTLATEHLGLTADEAQLDS